MDYIIPKNWKSFQHYKDRSPAWVKLHRSLLDNREFHRLPVASKALAPMLWLLASEYNDGKIPCDYDLIAFRLRITEKDAQSALTPLIDSCFFECYTDASNPLALCLPREEKRREYKAETSLGTFVPDKKTLAKTATRFDEFWALYPARPNRPKVGKKPCMGKWKARGLDLLADTIIANLKWNLAHNAEWRDGFAPNPEVYINQDRWLDGTAEAKPVKPEKTPEQLAREKEASIRETQAHVQRMVDLAKEVGIAI